MMVKLAVNQIQIALPSLPWEGGGAKVGSFLSTFFIKMGTKKILELE